jgi:WD40 repeat protein
VKLWDVNPDGRGRERPGGHNHFRTVWCLAFSPDGSLLASGSMAGHLKLWDVATGQARVMPDSEHDFTQAVGFSPDGRTLIAARATGIIQLWDIAERRRIATLGSEAESYGMAISGDGRLVASGGADAMIRVWDLTTSLTAVSTKD